MKQPVKKENSQLFEVIDYYYHAPFHIRNIVWKKQENADGTMRDVLEHWHPDLEIEYTLVGHAVHYIDGRPHTAYPGSLFIVNPESIHKVLSDTAAYKRDEIVAIILHINVDFLRQMIPNIGEMYFTADGTKDEEKMGVIMRELSCYSDSHPENMRPYDYLHIMSLIYELLYLLSGDRLVPREQALPVNSAKNLERLRGVMQFVETHYAQKLSQAEVAQQFHFTKEYFARIFRRNTGLTFMEYLTRYRLGKAKELLLESDDTVLNIALVCGFSDARGFINAFRKLYGTTPLQYRKGCAI
ncbi:MAG: AraC family transcriptional regulator [Lachnospiraceae bacterium]|jgi:AraC-like DNA-binding protein|nr:AraC family transcriptional regulator [Lachnospiraceae bacterium]